MNRATAQAALATANSNYNQVKASADLQVANAREQVNQAQATAKNTAVNLKRKNAEFYKRFENARVPNDLR